MSYEDDFKKLWEDTRNLLLSSGIEKLVYMKESNLYMTFYIRPRHEITVRSAVKWISIDDVNWSGQTRLSGSFHKTYCGFKTPESVLAKVKELITYYELTE